MPHFFIILLKINLVLVLFGAAYYLVLRRLTFYTLNRVFLVFGILFATIYPFIDLTEFFHQQNKQAIAFVPALNQKVTTMVPSKFIAMNWQLLTIVFYIGVVLMAFRLIMQFISLYRMHQKSSPGLVASYPVRILDEEVSPFSFWQTVYINPALHKENELQTILEHENIHVKQWHSLDIILAELSVVFYWFNPGVWLMKKAVKENLEFITDQKILNKGVDKKAYQYSLLDVGNLTPSVAIVNNFNLSDLKKRIKMMNAKRSSKLTLSRYLFVLPILLLTTLAFTVSKKDINKHLTPITQVFVKNGVINETDFTAKAKLIVKALNRKNKVNVKQITIKKDSVSTFRYIVNTIFLTTDSTKKPDLDQIVAVANLPVGTGKMVDLKLRLEGIAINADSTKARVMGRKIDNISFNGESTSEPTKQVTVVGYALRGTTDSLKASNVNFVVNGKKITKEELNKIDPEQIKTVKIEKGQELPQITVIGRKKP